MLAALHPPAELFADIMYFFPFIWRIVGFIFGDPND